MSNWSTSTEGLPTSFVEVVSVLSRHHGQPDDFAELDTRSGSEGLALVLFICDRVTGERTLESLIGLPAESGLNVVVVLSDGYLGTDLSDRTTAVWSAAAVSAVRSLATTRGSSVRANVVCVPEGIIGSAGEHRGPLSYQPDVSDVAEAVLFLMDGANSYVNGQVLFCDGGRHLYSSHTS